MGVSWTDEQRQAIDNRGGTLLESAAAGSGKTAVMVQRVLDVVAANLFPAAVDHILLAVDEEKIALFIKISTASSGFNPLYKIP